MVYEEMLPAEEEDEDPDERDEIEDDDVIDMPPEPLPDGIYGMAIASLLRDSAYITSGGKSGCADCIKFSRIGTSCCLIFLSLALQIFLVFSTKELITPIGVKHIRELYGRFEHTMYDGHVANSSNGYARGIPAYYNVTNFKKLSADDKDLACRIPLSQPAFLFVILLIWTMTVLKHCRGCVNLVSRLVSLPTVPSMTKDAIERGDDGAYNIVGLTCWMKLFVGLIQMAVLCMICFLLWLGARWLISTTGFSDLLLNAIALEFILDLPELIFNTMVPKRTQLDTQQTMIPHLKNHEGSGICSLFGMYILGIFGIVLVLVYMFLLEQVLPDYKYDVHEPCRVYLAQEMSLHR